MSVEYVRYSITQADSESLEDACRPAAKALEASMRRGSCELPCHIEYSAPTSIGSRP
jgi:hypothetical protein